MYVFSIDSNIDYVQKALDGIEKSFISIQRQSLSIVAKGTIKAIKRSINDSDLNKNSGELLKAYRYKISKDSSEANIYPKGINNNREIYPKVMILNYGHEGETKKRKDWKVKPRCFIQAGIDYLESGAFDDDLESMVYAEIGKYWGWE